METVFDFAKNEVRAGGYKNALSVDQKRLDIQIVYDRCCIEVFCDGGKIAFISCAGTVCDGNLPYLELSANGEYLLQSLSLKTFYNAKEIK